MAKYAALVSTASEGAVTTGSADGIAPGPALMAESRAAAESDRLQDVAAGRRLADARRDVGAGRRAHGRSIRGWMNDHITDPTLERGGSSWEALTALAALVHHVPGLTVGHGVLSNTFRHPVILAKAATALDYATGGRFVLGLGAGWHEGEHVPFGIPLPPIRERFDRFESAFHTIKALFGDAATAEAGVTRPDPYYPLDGATNLPPPLTRGGPPM